MKYEQADQNVCSFVFESHQNVSATYYPTPFPLILIKCSVCDKIDAVPYLMQLQCYDLFYTQINSDIR